MSGQRASHIIYKIKFINQMNNCENMLSIYSQSKSVEQGKKNSWHKNFLTLLWRFAISPDFSIFLFHQSAIKTCVFFFESQRGFLGSLAAQLRLHMLLVQGREKCRKRSLQRNFRKIFLEFFFTFFLRKTASVMIVDINVLLLFQFAILTGKKKKENFLRLWSREKALKVSSQI